MKSVSVEIASDSHIFKGYESPASIKKKRNKNDQKNFRSVKPLKFICKLLLLTLLFGMFGLCIIFFPYPFKIPFQILMGLLIAHATELVHQCIHRTATGYASLDHWLGRVLGWPSGTSFWYYCWFHLWHHKYNGTEQDKESFGYAYELMNSASRRSRVFGLLRHLSMVSHYWSTLRRMKLAIQGRLSKKLTKATPELKEFYAKKIQQDYIILAILLSLVVVISVVFQTFLLVNLWLIPLLIAWGPAHALIELPEHWGCDIPNGNVFVNTRSINAGKLARWFTNNNCNHVGHHNDMNVPMESLPSFEEWLMAKHDFNFYESSYPRFYFKFLRFIFR